MTIAFRCPAAPARPFTIGRGEALARSACRARVSRDLRNRPANWTKAFGRLMTHIVKTIIRTKAAGFVQDYSVALMTGSSAGQVDSPEIIREERKVGLALVFWMTSKSELAAIDNGMPIAKRQATVDDSIRQ